VNRLLQGYTTRIKRIVITGGLRQLFRSTIGYISRGLYIHGTVFLCEHTVKERNEKDFLPALDNYSVYTVESNQQADELESQGLYFRSSTVRAHKRLDKGAVAFCLFSDKELVHISWLAMKARVQRDIDPLPFKIDFSTQACSGGASTNPKYRGKGTNTYVFYLKLDYLLKQGKTACRLSFDIDNIPSIKVHAKFEPIIYATARYHRILHFWIYKEKPFQAGKGSI